MNKKVITALILLALVICCILVVYSDKDKATSVIATFTIVLTIATVWNATVTQGLLDQSREELRVSRIAFLVDMVERTVDYLNSIGSSDTKAAGHYLYRKIIIIGKIKENFKEEFLKDLKFWATGATARGKTIPSQAIQIAEQLLKERKI